MVNFGASFLHLRLTGKIAKPNDESIPKINPKNEPEFLFPNAIIIIPIAEINIDTHTLVEIFSFRNRIQVMQ